MVDGIENWPVFFAEINFVGSLQLKETNHIPPIISLQERLFRALFTDSIQNLVGDP
jgi:hypothetical protein